MLITKWSFKPYACAERVLNHHMLKFQNQQATKMSSTSAHIIKIGTKDVQTKELGEEPIIIDNLTKSAGVVVVV